MDEREAHPPAAAPRRGGPLALLAAMAAAAALLLAGPHRPAPAAPAPANAVVRLGVTRCAANPLVVPAASPTLGDNVNGPSLLRVPAWVEAPLGRYYLYFAHHRGEHVRLAFADAVCGPWTVHEPGVLHLDELPGLDHHVASPDVHVDAERGEILLYVHGRTAGPKRGQHTVLAVSRDGLRFEPVTGDIAPAYVRRFEHGDAVFAVANGGRAPGPMGEELHASILRSPDGRRPFERVKLAFPRMRHAALLRRGDHLLVFHSRKGDSPERILVSTLDLSGPPEAWTPSPPLEVLRPATPAEGADRPVAPSVRGPARGRLHQLRDPAVFEDDGRTWLLYAIAGEHGLAAAELAIELAP